MSKGRLICGDSIEALRELPDSSIGAVVTDPPYGLGDMSPARVAECLQAWARGEEWTPKGKGFMGKQWDAWVPPPELWREVLRVLKPGGHAVVFAGSRTQDLMSVSLRLAGFEVRDTLQWLYGSGFPKSLDISKALDKREGALGEVIHTETRYNEPNGIVAVGQGPRKLVTRTVRAPATEPAQQWQGWGTALKPAYEPAILARKPLDGTVAQNTLAHGCGGLNLDACRVGEEVVTTHGKGTMGGATPIVPLRLDFQGASHVGRFPANVILDEDAAALLDAQTSSTCSRFFYTAKASRAEREAGLEGRQTRRTGAVFDAATTTMLTGAGNPRTTERANHHPTVKPIALMRYLVKLVTPPHGTVLDPFTGSGSTGCAAALERVNFVGVELDPEYAEIARTRIKHWAQQGDEPQEPAPLAPEGTEPQEPPPPAPEDTEPQGSLF